LRIHCLIMKIELSITINNCMEVRFSGADHDPKVIRKLRGNGILLQINRNSLSVLVEAKMRIALEYPNGKSVDGTISKVRQHDGLVLLWCDLQTEDVLSTKEV
jgi:hypothetical protein